MSRRRCCPVVPCAGLSDCMTSPTATEIYVTLPSGWEQPARDNGCGDLDATGLPDLSGDYVLTGPGNGKFSYTATVVEMPAGHPFYWFIKIYFEVQCDFLGSCYFTSYIWIYNNNSVYAPPVSPCFYVFRKFVDFETGSFAGKNRSEWTLPYNRTDYYNASGIFDDFVVIDLPLTFSLSAP